MNRPAHPGRKFLTSLKATCLAVGLCAATATSSSAQSFTSLASFNSNDGRTPMYGSLVQGFDGDFYGTTFYGGAKDSGVVFNVTPTGTLTLLYSFCSKGYCVDGLNPEAGLAQGTNGNLYGTTSSGGTNKTVSCTAGCGTIFEITPAGKLTTLYSFCSKKNCTDGLFPIGGLVLSSDGNFYGTTYKGGLNGGGTLFKITPAGKLTTVYNFCAQTDCSDGAAPQTTLIQGANGDFYGTTIFGGSNSNCRGGCGTAFEITATGTITTLYRFCSQTNCADGMYPTGSLVQAANGKLYGTTGGSTSSSGTVFEITATGIITLYRFCSQTNCTDGSYPVAGLVQATDGNFYGTTEFGGDSSYGTAFEITPSGTLTILHSFDLTDGANPYGELNQSTTGNFYGTTNEGGTSSACYNACGTVFALSVGLSPFVETLPTGGNVNSKVAILGNLLSGTTSVTFNGVPATSFTVVSDTYMTAVVPSSATTGPVVVTTPTATLTSNKNFRVTQ